MKIISLPFLLSKKKTLLIVIMKTFLVICFLTTFGFTSKSVFSQDTEIVIKSNKVVPVEEVFDLLKEQTTHTYIYSIDLFDAMPKVTLKKGKTTVGKLLESTVSKLGYAVEYEEDGTILVFGSGIIPDNDIVKQEQSTVSGTVTDPTGMPIPGVNVIEKGTSNGVVTDFDGEFSIDVSPGDVLIFSYLGYETIEREVEGDAPLDIIMETSASALEEVVVVGYGTQEKASMTSAVTTVSGEDLTERSSRNLSSSLQGLAPGLTVWDRGGAPGSANMSVNIRGVTTLGGNNPLVIVDGIEQNLNDIDPNNIESLSILKDAASTAIYGSRGANGVIIVTTKRGEEGDLQIRYKASVDFQNLTMVPEHLGTEEYLRLQNTAYINRGSDPLYSEEEIEGYVSGEDRLQYPLPNNWFDVVIRENAPMQRHMMAISGGTEQLRTNVIFNYFNQEGLYPNQDSQRYGIRINNDLELSQDLNVRADINLSRKNRYTFNNEGNVYHRMIHSSQFTVPRFPDGTYGLSRQGHNPLAWTDTEIVGATESTSDAALINLQATWDILDNLSFTSQYGIDVNKYSSLTNIPTYEIRDYFNPDVIKRRNNVNELSENRSESLRRSWNNTLNYDLDISSHSLGLLLGYSEISNDYKGLYANGRDFYNDELLDLGLSDPLSRDLSSSYTDWGLRSFFGRLNYSFRERYIIEFNMRYDGSSRFPAGSRYIFFPSVAGAWRISEEDFWEPLEETINEFKLRGSWGETGNQNVGLYTYFENLNLANYYVFGGTPVTGVRQTNFTTPNLTWETTTQTNLGFDLAMFDNQFNVIFDWYNKITEGILLSLPLPGLVGLYPSASNAGSVKNTGWELQLNYRDMIGDFDYNATFGISDLRNEIISLAGTGPYFSGEDDRLVRMVGEEIDALWGYRTDGYYTPEDFENGYPTLAGDAKLGDIKYLDLNNDGTINADDKTIIGSTIPHLTYSANIEVGWKNFDFLLQLQGVGEQDMSINGAFIEAGSWEGFTPAIAGDYWTPENTDALFPRPQKQTSKNSWPADRWVVDGSYLRLKNLQLGYSFSEDLLNEISLKNLRLFVGGTNLFTVSELNEWGIDAESPTGRGDFYPTTRNYTIGVNLTL